MSNIQYALITSLIFLLFFYLRFFRNRVFNALFFLCFFMVGIIIIIHPSFAQDMATFFGVGRGVDLIFYFLFIIIFFLFISVFYKTRDLGKTIIDLVRAKAIADAQELGKKV